MVRLMIGGSDLPKIPLCPLFALSLSLSLTICALATPAGPRRHALKRFDPNGSNAYMMCSGYARLSSAGGVKSEPSAAMMQSHTFFNLSASGCGAELAACSRSKPRCRVRDGTRRLYFRYIAYLPDENRCVGSLNGDIWMDGCPCHPLPRYRVLSPYPNVASTVFQRIRTRQCLCLVIDSAHPPPDVPCGAVQVGLYGSLSLSLSLSLFHPLFCFLPSITLLSEASCSSVCATATRLCFGLLLLHCWSNDFPHTLRCESNDGSDHAMINGHLWRGNPV